MWHIWILRAKLSMTLKQSSFGIALVSWMIATFSSEMVWACSCRLHHSDTPTDKYLSEVEVGGMRRPIRFAFTAVGKLLAQPLQRDIWCMIGVPVLLIPLPPALNLGCTLPGTIIPSPCQNLLRTSKDLSWWSTADLARPWKRRGSIMPCYFTAALAVHFNDGMGSF